MPTSKGEQLWDACNDGNDAEARQLIDEGADVEWRDLSAEETPLMRAADNGHEDVVRLLLDTGASINARNNGYITPLHFAASNRDNDGIVSLLIQRGADIHTYEPFLGFTPLESAEKPDGSHSPTFAVLKLAIAATSGKDNQLKYAMKQ